MANSHVDDDERDFLFEGSKDLLTNGIGEAIINSCIATIERNSQAFHRLFSENALPEKTGNEFISFLSRCDKTLDAFARLQSRDDPSSSLKRLSMSILNACVKNCFGASVDVESLNDDSRSNCVSSSSPNADEDEIKTSALMSGNVDLCFHRASTLFLKCVALIDDSERLECFKWVSPPRSLESKSVVSANAYFACYVCRIALDAGSLGLVPESFSESIFRAFLGYFRDFELSVDSTKVTIACATSVFPLVFEQSKKKKNPESFREKLANTWQVLFGLSLSTDGHPRFGLKNEISYSVAVSIFDQLASSPVLANAQFWDFLRRGLTHVNSGTRKRARFLFGAALNHLGSDDESHSNFEVIDGTAISFFLPAGKGKERQAWIAFWNTLLIFFETLEEKQVHVIKPVLSRITDVINFYENENHHHQQQQHNDNQGAIDVSWICAILTRALVHESRAISRWGVVTCLELAATRRIKSQLLRSSSANRLLCTDLLLAFNHEQVFSRWGCGDDSVESFAPGERPPVARALGNFVLRMTTEAAEEEHSAAEENGYDDDPSPTSFFLRFLRAVRNVQWSQVPIVYVVEALSEASSMRYFSAEVIDLLMEMLSQNVAFTRCVKRLVSGFSLLGLSNWEIFLKVETGVLL